MSSRNHALTDRPLQGGILIINPTNGRPGTLGAIATRTNADRYALSCYHVLGRAGGGAFTDGEPIWQSLQTKGGTRVGQVFAADCAAQLDLAAARLDPAIATVGAIMGLGPLAAPTDPVAGMRLVKAGAVTGVTEGQVAGIQGNQVRIRRPAGYPTGYELCDFGDSGALWIDPETGAPVALHTGQAPNGEAIALVLGVALAALQLTLVLGNQ